MNIICFLVQLFLLSLFSGILNRIRFLFNISIDQIRAQIISFHSTTVSLDRFWDSVKDGMFHSPR